MIADLFRAFHMLCPIRRDVHGVIVVRAIGYVHKYVILDFFCENKSASVVRVFHVPLNEWVEVGQVTRDALELMLTRDYL